MIATEGYVIPLHIRDGLPRMDMRIPTDEEMEKFPHAFLTSDSPWDPSALDNEFETDTFHDALMEDPKVQEHRNDRDNRVDDHGFLRSREDHEVLF